MMGEQFTEDVYGRLLDQAKARFRFVTMGSPWPEGNICLWRHDIDMSPHRAVRLAEMEAERGLRAHYFVMFGSRFYNPFEPSVSRLLRRLSDLGHLVGLHFDAAAQPMAVSTDAEAGLRRDAEVLATLLSTPVTTFSLHNPTTSACKDLDQPSYGRLLNASAPSLMSTFTYSSDSNGIWRHRPLADVVGDPVVTRLYALTHPEWWPPDAMSARARVQRCIDGRALTAGRDYDAEVAAFGRP